MIWGLLFLQLFIPIAALFLYSRKTNISLMGIKLPTLVFCIGYDVFQIIIFIKYGFRIRAWNEDYVYIPQVGLICLFLLLLAVAVSADKYIKNVDDKEHLSSSDFKSLIERLEIKTVTLGVSDKRIDDVCEALRYANPVSTERVFEENSKLYNLIENLSEENIQMTCDEMKKVLTVRNTKLLRRD